MSEGRSGLTGFAQRLAMYRAADRILVDEEVVAIPLHYNAVVKGFVKPWVKRRRSNALGNTSLKEIVIEPH